MFQKCLTDHRQADGFCIEAHNLIRVPEDLSVIGFDKLELFSAVFPGLTLQSRISFHGKRKAALFSAALPL